MAARIAQHQGKRVLVVDLVPERLERARARGLEVFDTAELGKNLPDAIRDATDGRGTDSVIDAVGMEAHGSPVARALLQATSMLPDAIAAPMAKRAGVDQLAALHSAIDIVRRGGTVSLIGVYAGAADPMPLATMFDKQIQFRMGQANVKKWVPDILPLLTNEDRWTSSSSPPTACRSPTPRTPMRSSRRSKREQSRSCSIPSFAPAR
jgi:threonine dehydrogenase-like Zn-dependent dehydrogenase